MKTVTTLLNYVMIFVSLNKGAKANSKQLMKEALDIGVALHHTTPFLFFVCLLNR